jgi:phospholipid/cholesterol/gamma-HCH transport system substrate-binding protein
MKNSLETRLGIFVALTAIAAFIVIEVIGGPDFFKPAYKIRARFNNIQDLKVADPVKMAGVPVGRVEKLSLVDDKVEVILRLNKGTPVHTDSKATVKFASLMGQNYVSIDFGSPTAPLLLQNELITTTEQPDLNSLMARLDEAATGIQNLTKSFTGDKIDNLLGPFTDFMRQNSPRLTAILGNMQNISSQVASGEGTVGKLIYDQSLYNNASSTVSNLQGVMGDARETINQAKATLTQAHNVVDQVNAGQGTIGKLLKDDQLYRQTTGSMSNLNSILSKINSGQGSVGRLVNDQEFYKDAKLSLQKLDKATESLEDTGPLSILGSLVTTLF